VGRKLEALSKGMCLREVPGEAERFSRQSFKGLWVFPYHPNGEEILTTSYKSHLEDTSRRLLRHTENVPSEGKNYPGA
jgi:hypothetical protein